MNGMTSAAGSLCMPVVAMVDVLGQQEAKARIGPLPLADGSLKLHAALLRSTGLASVSDQESPQAAFQKVPWGRQNAATCNIPYTSHETDQLSTKSALYLEELSSSPFVMLSYSSGGGMPSRSPTVASAGSTRVQEGASPQGHKRAEAHLDELHQLGNDAQHFGWRFGCC